MTAPEAEHHNQHSLPVTLSLRTSQSPHDLPSNHNATRKEFTSLNQQVSTFYSAELLQGIHTEDVFQFLSSAISPMYVTGIKELIKTGEAHGFETELQFFRCNDRSTIAPVALAFKKITLAGDVMYGLPNVSAILDAPEERLRGDNSSSGKKLTRATDGTAEDGEAGTYGGKITFETFRDPVRILISESTDTELHRPFDLAAQYSPTIESDAVARMTEALTSEGPFSFLAECVIHPHLTQFLSRYSQLFGAREKADIVQVTQHKEGSLLITVLNPELKEGVPLTFRTEIDFSPFASVRLSEVDESR
jgi:hypothetical protein